MGPWCAGLDVGVAARTARLRVHFLDVDQADATLVVLPSGRSLLVDAGGAVHGGFDIGSRVVAPALWAAGLRRLDYLTNASPIDRPCECNNLAEFLGKQRPFAFTTYARVARFSVLIGTK